MTIMEQKPPRSLTNFHYGSHSGVQGDVPGDVQGDVPGNAHESRAPVSPDEDPAPKSHRNMPAQPYRPQPGANEPPGVERYGMYGVAPGADAPSPAPTGAGAMPQRPLPGPASLGQFDGDDMRPVAPLSDVQRLEVLHERLATVIDPGVVKVDMVDGAVTLRGTVRDAATRKAVEGIAKGCLSDYYVRSEIDVSEGRTSR